MRSTMQALSLSWVAAAIVTAVALAQTAQRIELTDFQKLHTAQGVLVVDVRDPDSFAAGHIPGAINIPLGEQEQAAHFARLKAEKRPIVTYCA